MTKKKLKIIVICWIFLIVALLTTGIVQSFVIQNLKNEEANALSELEQTQNKEDFTETEDYGEAFLRQEKLLGQDGDKYYE